ncbi:unnamed protein product [Brachionus calyciflorus]|uniref:FERM domain-containing protein n=1 Tax=Brachionus calyciflorus TaxID=104777 RepID=A0A813R2F0_9BILA|nr:unnamed protein product [Brachionus calyciflorus]
MLCLKVQKDFKFKVALLDDRDFKLSYNGSQKCEKILIDVAKMLNLREKEYFSFRYNDSENEFVWIDHKFSIFSQFKSFDTNEITLYFNVKHYITDPSKLNDELTRYLYYLQLRKDILQGKLTLQFDYAVDLFSYFLQDELGDYNSKRDSHGYASEFEFVPNQSLELEASAEAKHIKLKGMSQDAAEMNFLNKAKWLDSYGVDLYPVKGEDNSEYDLGINPTGICVYQSNAKIESYFWPRIKKFNHKINKFIITVIDKTNVEKTFSYILKSKTSCRNFYQTCEDHLKFFKAKTVYKEPAKLNTALVMGNSKSTKINKDFGSKNTFKRAPAKRLKRRQNDYSKAENSQEETKEESEIKENVISENGNLIFFTNEQKSLDENETNDCKTVSPAVSTKTINSQKYSNNRQESASEGENVHRKKNGNRSRNRRSNGNQIEINNKDREKSQDSDSDPGLVIKRPIYKSESKLNIRKIDENGQIIQRNSGNRGSNRRRHRSHSRGSNKGSNHNTEWTHLVGQKHQGKSRKSLTSQKSGSNLIFKDKKSRYDGSETCHETTMDEMDPNEIERKRQIRRRKRSKSPGNVSKPPEEILQHINYNLVEASGLNADQLKEIPFVKIETCAPPFRISPHHNKRRMSPHRRKSYDYAETKSTVTYMSNGTAQIKKLADTCDYVMVNVTTKQNVVSMGSAVNSKLQQFIEPMSNNGLSADSGCEDMSSRIDIKQI